MTFPFEKDLVAMARASDSERAEFSERRKDVWVIIFSSRSSSISGSSHATDFFITRADFTT